MRQPPDLMARLKAAMRADSELSESAEYYAPSDGALTSIGSALGTVVAGSLGTFLARHGPQVFVASLTGLGALGAAFFARSLGQQVGLRHGTALGYVVLVTVTGIVASVAVSAVDDDPTATGMS